LATSSKPKPISQSRKSSDLAATSSEATLIRPQYLLLTVDSFRSQNEHLHLEDIEAACAFLRATISPHFVMYNCTKDAGCSRYHKHLQIIPKPEACDSDFRFFPDVKDSAMQVPYVHFVQHFTSNSPLNGQSVYDTYLDQLKKCRAVLGIDEDDENTLCPHNMILVDGWIAVIPRARGSFEGVGANAAGMLGMPTISNSMLLKKWTDIGPTKVLRELGVSTGTSN
jgi:ATP adenylyltransferase/5',5'''-P-1,P-4-tetraphosphate phosphorylase II